LAEDLQRDFGANAIHLAFMEIASPNLLDAAREMMKTKAAQGIADDADSLRELGAGRHGA